MPSSSIYRSNAEDGNLGTRLDCWKEIATYLGKVERTVKRWEVDRGLPIHRVPGGGRASVYAYTHELDEWLKSPKTAEVVPQAVDPEAAAQITPRPVPTATAIPASSSMSVPTANSSAPASLHAPEPAAPPSVLRTKWPPALGGVLLFIFFVVTGIYSAHVGTTGQRFLRPFRVFSARKAVEKVSVASISVSDSEKSQAHELYLKGRYQWNLRTPDSLHRALDYFTQAIVHDPGYAEAYVGMADTYDLLREFSTMPDNEAYSRAIAAARKAVELDDSLAEAHRALAFAEWWGAWDFVDGEKEFRRAIDLNPKDPAARKWYANVLSIQGRFSEALAENQRAEELDPTSHSILADRGWMLFNAGRRDEGIALLKEVERSAPEFLSPHNYLMAISLELRDYPAFIEEGEKTAEGENDAVLKNVIAAARAGFKRNGERGLLNELYAKQKEYYQAGNVPGTTFAKTCILMGKKHEAVQLLAEAYKRHEANVLSCLSESDLLVLRSDPAYKALVEKISLSLVPRSAQPDNSPASDLASFHAASEPR